VADTPISRDDVAHVARLARLTVADEELDLFTEQLASILGHVADVEALELDDVPPTSHPYPLENVTRPDEVHECLDRDEVVAQAPASESGMFRVPPVLGEAP
jgi:aspartyl-tRNA(Asn)/glutamyl-tRNA(Gln) amidotransferase subunit C